MANEDQKQKKCFIITPIGGEKSSIRRHADGVIDAVVDPALSNMDYEVIVSHRISDGGSITRQVIENIINCDLVVANLTGLNPNVMYELAIRHAVRKPVIQICEIGTTLPFDISEQRTIFYTNDMAGSVELQSQFEIMVEKAIKDEQPDNPIYRVIENNSIIQKIDVPNTDKYLLNRLDQLETNLTHLMSSRSRHYEIGVNRYDESSKKFIEAYRIAKPYIIELRGEGRFSTKQVQEYLADHGINASMTLTSQIIQKVIHSMNKDSIDME